MPCRGAFGTFLPLMSLEPARPAAWQDIERRFHGPLKIWEFLFLFALTISIIAAACWQSSKQYLNNDELCTALLVANPRFSEMWSAIERGGEVNPPLFFVGEWLIAQTFGMGELALRAISIVSTVVAGGLLFVTVRPLTGPRLAALAVALVFGLSRFVFDFAADARYYGVFLLLVCWGAFLAVRLAGVEVPRRKNYALVFVAHFLMVYLHLFGLLFSGALLLAMAMSDWLCGKLRWGLYGCVVAAWLSFGAWAPFMLRQVKSAGAYTPPGYHTIGYFLEQLAFQTPLGLAFLLVALLGGLALILAQPCPASEEANNCDAPRSWIVLALLAVCLMGVPVASWLGSFFITALFMPRYVFPAVASWVMIVALGLLALFRLPRPQPPFPRAIAPSIWNIAWAGVLLFCLLFQPLRAWKNPARAASPFVEEDYGYKDLPIVFEDSWFYLPRAFYGRGREYLMLIDEDAGQADAGWYTNFMVRYFRNYYPKYQSIHVARARDLPSVFLAVDDDQTKTFEWLFAHHPDWKTQLLGSRKADLEYFGQQRVYLVSTKQAP